MVEPTGGDEDALQTPYEDELAECLFEVMSAWTVATPRWKGSIFRQGCHRVQAIQSGGNSFGKWIEIILA